MAGSNGGSPYGTRANGRISPGDELPQASGFQTYYSMPHHAIVQPYNIKPPHKRTITRFRKNDIHASFLPAHDAVQPSLNIAKG